MSDWIMSYICESNLLSLSNDGCHCLVNGLQVFFAPSNLFYANGSRQTEAQQMYYIYTALFEGKKVISSLKWR